MKPLVRLFFIIGLMLSISMVNTTYISAQVIDGPIGRNQLKRNVLKMVYQEKFDDLEIMAQEFRKTKARFPEGMWKMDYFYEGLSSPKDESPDGWKRFMPKFDKWLKLYPDSVTARVASGSAWKAFAWNARGGGYANTVSSEGWRLFEERMEKAYSIVEKKPDKPGEDCVGRYDLLLSIANAQGWDRAQYEALFREAVSFEPTYLVHYVRKVYYLLPRWHGKRGEWQQFAQEAVRMTPPKEGKAVYMRILWGCWNMKEFKSFNEPGISWPMMKQGFIDTERNFPDSPWNLNNFCRFAYFAGDKETAQKLLVRIGNRPYWEAWERQEFQECQN